MDNNQTSTTELLVTSQPLGNGRLNLMRHIADSANVVVNVQTDYIITTRDKVSNVLHSVIPQIRRRTEWVGAFGLVSSLVVVLLSTEFSKKLFGLSAETWTALFYLATGLSTLWLIWAVIGAVFRSASHASVLADITATHEDTRGAPLQGTVHES